MSLHPAPTLRREISSRGCKLEHTLDRYWERGQPSGDGAAYRDRILKIWLDRLDQKARNEGRAERLWLLGKTGAATLVFVAVLGYLA